MALPSVLLAACAHQSVTSFDLNKVDSRTAIIFIPGYYGTSLEDDHHTRRFITASEALFGGKALSLENETLATPKAPHLQAEGVLLNVPVLPLVSVDVYGDFIDHLNTLAKNRNQQVIAFAYDWRQELAASAAQLDVLIDSLHAKGVRHITLITHSMGCLLTAYELGYGAQPLAAAVLDWRGAKKVDGVVFMAGPFDGVFSIFRNMQRGAALAGNTSLLPKEAVASFPASYELLPFRRLQLLSYEGAKIPVSLRNPAYWRKHQISLLWNQNLPSDLLARRDAFTDEQVRSAAHFADLIHFEGGRAPESLRVMSLVGHGHKTVASAFYNESTNDYMFDIDRLGSKNLKVGPLLGDGDGTVLVSSAQLPPALANHATLIGSTEEHGHVYNNAAFISELDKFLP